MRAWSAALTIGVAAGEVVSPACFHADNARVMEKVNAMKKVTLFLMVVALAVVFTACQEAVGNDGDDGAAGDPGTQGPQGDPGPQGPSGFSGLIAMQEVKPLWVNDGPDARGKSTIGTSLIGPDGVAISLPASIDPADFFFGGTDMVSYSLVPWNFDEEWAGGDGDGTGTPNAIIDPMSVFTVSMEAGMLTIAKRATGARLAGDEYDDYAPADEHHYGRGTQFRLVARDGVTNIVAHSDTISIVRNRQPNTEDDAGGTVTVGEQDGFPAAATPAQKMDPCNAINVVCVNVVDPDGENGDDDRWFRDWMAQYLKYTPTPTAASDGFVSAAMEYKYNDANIDNAPAYFLMATGLKAGVDADGNPAAKMTEIEVIATDAGGLNTKAREEAVWVVNVDPAPRVKTGISPNTREVTSPTAERGNGDSILDDVSRFFEDNFPAALQFSAKIKTNTAGAIVAPTNVEDLIEDNTNNLVVVGLSPGTAVITITATEGDDSNSTDEPSPPLEQSVSLDVTVTVK